MKAQSPKPTHARETKSAEPRRETEAKNQERPPRNPVWNQLVWSAGGTEGGAGRSAAAPEGPPVGGPEALGKMESAFGVSFADVKLRIDDAAASSAAALGVQAFTNGREIFFGRGAFAPQTERGRETLAHELAHVLQRRGGTQGTPPVMGSGAGESSTKRAAEADARRAASDVLRGVTPRVASVPWSGFAAQDPAAESATPDVKPGTFNLDVTKAGVVISTLGSTVKGWKDPVFEAFVLYLKKAYPGIDDAIARACAADLKSKLQWIDKNQRPPPDDEIVQIDIDHNAQRVGREWMQQHHPELTPTPPQTGNHAIPKVGVPTAPSSEQKPGDKTKEGLDSTGTKVPGGGEGGEGTGEAIRMIDPQGKIVMQPELTTYLADADITAAFLFEGDSDTTLFNFWPFVRKVDFDWSVQKDGSEVDSGPIFEAGASAYTFDVEPGTYSVRVTLSSRHFKGGKTLSVSRSIVVEKEAERRQKAFDSLLAGPEPHKPFEYDANGKLKLKAAAQARTIDDQINELAVMLGAIEARAGRGELSEADFKAYKEYFEEQIAALKAVKVKTKGSNRYQIHGVFQSRDDGSVRAINAVMNGHEVTAGGGRVGYAVAIHDFTFSPGSAIKHSASSTVEVVQGDRAAALAKAERQAVDGVGNDWHWYNDFPDGTIQLGVQLLHSSEIRTVVVDTYNVKKTGRKVLTGVAIAGGAVAVAMSGGTAAPVALLVVEGISLAAGATLAADAIIERLNTGTFKLDSSLVLDMLSLVPLAGTLARAGGRAYKGMMLIQLGSGIAEFALISFNTRAAITATMARYEALIEKAPTSDEKAKLESERDIAIAKILGGAAVSGGLSLVSTAVAVKGAAADAPPPKARGAGADTPPPGPKPAAEAPPAAKPATEAPPVAKPGGTDAPAPKPKPKPGEAETPEPKPKPGEAEPPAKKGQAEEEAPAPKAPDVPKSGERWGIPEGGQTIPERKQAGGKPPKYAEDNPELYWYDPATGKYKLRFGFPEVSGAGHKIPCFPAGTPVHTPDGARAIETLRPGDEVLSFAEHAGEVVPTRVLESHVNRAVRLYRLRLDESEVDVTGEHLFWVGPGDYRAARDLDPGVRLRTVEGSLVPLRRIETHDIPESTTYNLTVAANFNYFAGPAGILVHNDGPFQIYLGIDPVTNEVVYVGQTEQTLAQRQTQHRSDAKKYPEKYAGKKDMILKWARGPQGALLTNLTQDEAWYWERKVYDRELAANAKLGASEGTLKPKLANLQVPYSDEKMAKLVTKHCK